MTAAGRDIRTLVEQCRALTRSDAFSDAVTKACDAEALFNNLLVEDQHDHLADMNELYCLHSECLWRQGKKQDAIDRIVMVYKLNPRSSEFAAKVGTFLRKAKLYDMAATYFQRALEIDPQNIRSKMALKALQTDIKLQKNQETETSPSSTNAVGGLVLPVVPPLPSNITAAAAETWNLDDVSIDGMSSVGSFSMPLSRAEMRFGGDSLYSSSSFGSPSPARNLYSNAASVNTTAPTSLQASIALPHSEGKVNGSSTPSLARNLTSSASLVVQQKEEVSPSVLLVEQQRKTLPSSSPPRNCSFVRTVASPGISEPRRSQERCTQTDTDVTPSSIGKPMLSAPASIEPPSSSLLTQQAPLADGHPTKNNTSPLSPSALWKRACIAFLLVVILHNALEGSSRPVFRVFGVPLSVISVLVVLAAIVM